MSSGVKKLSLIAVVAAVVLALSGARASGSSGLVTWISVSNGGSLFQGDNRLLTTVSPNGDGFRDKAVIHFALSRAADVRRPAHGPGTRLERDVRELQLVG
jgi:hypothetical protein